MRRAQGGVPQRSDRQLVTGAAPRTPGQEGRHSKRQHGGGEASAPSLPAGLRASLKLPLPNTALPPPPRRALAPPPPPGPGLTFMRSYLSSTSCSQEMNWRALNRSRTDLFSSPWRESEARVGVREGWAWHAKPRVPQSRAPSPTSSPRRPWGELPCGDSGPRRRLQAPLRLLGRPQGEPARVKSGSDFSFDRTSARPGVAAGRPRCTVVYRQGSLGSSRSPQALAGWVCRASRVSGQESLPLAQPHATTCLGKAQAPTTKGLEGRRLQPESPVCLRDIQRKPSNPLKVSRFFFLSDAKIKKSKASTQSLKYFVDKCFYFRENSLLCVVRSSRNLKRYP